MGITAHRVSRRSILTGTASFFALSACAVVEIPPAPLIARAANLDGFVYHPVPLHLDLCILSYQLYAQSLVWPFDPYYEKFGGDAAREAKMNSVRSWVAARKPSDPGPAVGGYRGPGALAGFPNNPLHDPIVFRYDTLRPWQPALSLPEVSWTEQQAPSVITSRIADVMMCYRPRGSAVDAVQIDRVARAGRAAVRGARDQLIAFEGETGDKGELGQPGSQSMMGFVLKRHIAGSHDYDIHIVFRGSRSGEVFRTATRALSETAATGNPDWITDLGFYFATASQISTVGRLHRGIMRSTISIVPKVMASLARIAANSNGKHPKRIFVTGHSLGGGLAAQFASAVMLGNAIGPDGKGPAMPAELRNWPWTTLKLITFGAPVSGDKRWAEALTVDKLQSDFFESATWGTTLTDPEGLPINSPEIASRLADPTRPVAYRILNPKDRITPVRYLGGKHVGQTVYVARVDPLGLVDPNVHEPADIRDRIIAALNDPAAPPNGWHYRPVSDLSPINDPDNPGTPIAIDRLAAAITRYYRLKAMGFDQARFQSDYTLFKRIVFAR